MHFVFLSLKQIGTAYVYSSPSTEPSSSLLLETVDNVYIYIYIGCSGVLVGFQRVADGKK